MDVKTSVYHGVRKTERKIDNFRCFPLNFRAVRFVNYIYYFVLHSDINVNLLQAVCMVYNFIYFRLRFDLYLTSVTLDLMNNIYENEQIA